MSPSGQPVNRKQRRAAAKNSPSTTGTDSPFQPSTELDQKGVEYILKHPDRSGPKGKTLFELAEERQRELNKGKPPNWNAPKSNTPDGERPFNDEDPIGPLGNALLYSFSLAALHLTLDVLVYSQYREVVIWREIFTRAGTALPIFFVLVYLLHTELCTRFATLRNLFFLAVSITAGCQLVYSGNKNGYFFVMKTAPPVGSLWVWSVIEMNLPYALANVLIVLAYVLWNGFELF